MPQERRIPPIDQNWDHKRQDHLVSALTEMTITMGPILSLHV